jgi:hypothetical protein
MSLNTKDLDNFLAEQVSNGAVSSTIEAEKEVKEALYWKEAER